MNMTSIGLIGLGFIGMNHLKVLTAFRERGILDNRVVAAADSSRERLTALGERFGIERLLVDTEALFEDPEIEAVIIAAPWASHAPLVRKALASGKRVYCEKPLAKNLMEVRELAELEKESGRTHHTGLVLRHSPLFRKILEIIQVEELGAPLLTTLSEDSAFPRQGMFKTPWEERLAGRGIVWEENIHDLDALTFILGDLTLETASLLEASEKPGIEIGCRASFRCANGGGVQFSSLWHNVRGRGSHRRLELFFDQGVIAADYFVTGNLELSLNVPGMKRHQRRRWTRKELRNAHRDALGLPEALMTLYNQKYTALSLYAFLGNHLGDVPNAPSFAEALPAHALAEKIYQRGERLNLAAPLTPSGEHAPPR